MRNKTRQLKAIGARVFERPGAERLHIALFV